MRRDPFKAILSCLALMLAGGTSLGAAPPGGGDDPSTRAAARALATEGREAYVAGDYVRAIDRFRRAYALLPAPTITIYEARALQQSGRFVEASEAYERTMHASIGPDSPEQFRRAIREAEAERAKLAPRIPKFVLVLNGTAASDLDLALTADGEPVSRSKIGVEIPADPGPHRVTVRSSDGKETARDFLLRETETKRVELRIDSDAASRAVPISSSTDGPGPPQGLHRADRSHGRTNIVLGYVALGVGVAGVGTGLATGLMAASERDAAENQCPRHVCTEGTEGERALDSFRALRTVSTVSYIGGALGIATGVTLLLLPSGSDRGKSLRPLVGAHWAGVAGAF